MNCIKFSRPNSNSEHSGRRWGEGVFDDMFNSLQISIMDMQQICLNYLKITTLHFYTLSVNQCHSSLHISIHTHLKFSSNV